ncbi:MAG: hypothetical protein ACKOFB_04595, partial [bacterium]
MKLFFSTLLVLCIACLVNATPLHAQFEEDLPQITTEDTLKASIRTVWKGIKRAFNELGTLSDPSTRDPKMDEKTGLSRGFIRSDFRVFTGGK